MSISRQIVGIRWSPFAGAAATTTGFSVHASVLEAEDAIPADSGNVFVAEDTREPSEAIATSRAVVRVEWKGPGRVFLGYGLSGKVFKAERSLGGVSIEYEGAR